MGRPKKDPETVRSVPLNFRVAPPVKAAIDAMVQARAAETGDDSVTGWFLALVHQEARRAGVPISYAETETKAEPAPQPKRAAKKGVRGAT